MLRGGLDFHVGSAAHKHGAAGSLANGGRARRASSDRDLRGLAMVGSRADRLAGGDRCDDRVFDPPTEIPTGIGSAAGGFGVDQRGFIDGRDRSGLCGRR